MQKTYLEEQETRLETRRRGLFTSKT